MAEVITVYDLCHIKPRPVSIRIYPDDWNRIKDLLGLEPGEDLTDEFPDSAVYISKTVPAGKVLVLWPDNLGCELINLPQENP